MFDAVPGRLTLYTQTLDAGYSAPGLTTLTDTQHHGGTFTMQLMERVQLRAKADRKSQAQGYEIDAQELNVGYQLTDNWSVSTGARKDAREYRGPLVPLNQEQGERTDGVMQVDYDSRQSWRAYAFVQDTLSRTDGREDNGRFGTGGSYRFTERLRADVEVSDGDLGPGGRLGTNFLYSERTTLYLNYALENERTDNGLRSGRRGNLISGMKRRLSDSSSMYLEERYQETDSVSGLAHSTGMSLAPNDRWNFGASTDVGTLVDSNTGAKIAAPRCRIGDSSWYCLITAQLNRCVSSDRNRLIVAARRTRGAPSPDRSFAGLINWGCLMNSFYLDNKLKPHLHWHFIPRYREPVKFAGHIFEDPHFGYMRPRPPKEISPDVREKIISKIEEHM